MTDHQFICGDANAIVASLPSQSIDFVLTDPPYLCRYRDRSGRTVRGDHSGSNVLSVFKEVCRALKPDSYCVSFYGWSAIAEFSEAWREAGFRTVGHIVWVKRYASGQGYTRRRHESAFVLAKGNPQRPEKPVSDVMDWRYSGNKNHPTEKAVNILSPLIQAFSKSGDTVLDPFSGSGSTALASAIRGRRAIAIDVEPQYCEIARHRVEQSLMKAALCGTAAGDTSDCKIAVGGCRERQPRQCI